jgi:hypothetical protein
VIVAAKLRSTVEAHIEDLNKKHGFNYAAKEETLPQGYMMVADVLEGNVAYDPNNIADLYNHPSYSEEIGIHNVNDFIEILLVHELGHLIDFVSNPHLFEGNENLEQLEINAWEIGLTLIDENLIDDFNRFKDISMEHYKRDDIF